VAMGVAGKQAPARVQAAAPVPSASAASGTVALRLSASPEGARLFLDERPLPGNPFRGDLPRDGAAHRLRVEAAGFLTWNEDVVFDRDRGFEIALTAAPGAPPAAASSIASPHVGQPASLPSRHRRLDVTNPYAR